MQVVPRVQGAIPKRSKKAKKEPMGVAESFAFLAKNPYIRDLAFLVRPATRSSPERALISHKPLSSPPGPPAPNPHPLSRHYRSLPTASPSTWWR